MNENYSAARGYAYKLLRGQYHIDLVHDTFLAYFLKKNKNLFEEPLWLVLKVMRDNGVNYLRKIEGRGKYKYQYREIDEHNLISEWGPLEMASANQFLECINQLLTPSERETLSLKIAGYPSHEIGSQLNISRSGVDYRIEKARNIAKNLQTFG